MMSELTEEQWAELEEAHSKVTGILEVVHDYFDEMARIAPGYARTQMRPRTHDSILVEEFTEHGLLIRWIDEDGDGWEHCINKRYFTDRSRWEASMGDLERQHVERRAAYQENVQRNALERDLRAFRERDPKAFSEWIARVTTEYTEA